MLTLVSARGRLIVDIQIDSDNDHCSSDSLSLLHDQ